MFPRPELMYSDKCDPGKNVTYLRHCCLGSRASLRWPDKRWCPSRPRRWCCQSERNLYPWMLGSRSCSSPLPSEYSLCNYLKIQCTSFLSFKRKKKLNEVEPLNLGIDTTVIQQFQSNAKIMQCYGSNFSELYFLNQNPMKSHQIKLQVKIN